MVYRLKPGIKEDPVKRWALPDRIFFGHGACHILAGVYLQNLPIAGFHAERVVSLNGYWGNHIFVTNGEVAFDFHGYSDRSRLLAYHRKSWSFAFKHWDCLIETVDFDLLDTAELNARKMLGPDQYLFDAISRAERFLGRIDHSKASAKAYVTKRT